MPTRNAMKNVYYVDKPDTPVAMYIVDANSAVQRFPKEWSFTPWSKTGDTAVPIVEIPEGWEDLKPSERVTLAVKLGAKRMGLTSAKADEIIDAEQQKRAAASAPAAKAPVQTTVQAPPAPTIKSA